MESIYTYKTDSAKPAIYSPRVVLVFSALFGGLGGGILVFYSLRAVGQRVGARRALAASFIFMAALICLVILFPFLGRTTGLSLVLGLGWGYFIKGFYLKKYLPNEAVYPRKNWLKPLIIWIVFLAVLFQVGWIVFSGT